jgi:hypothetical protein
MVYKDPADDPFMNKCAKHGFYDAMKYEHCPTCEKMRIKDKPNRNRALQKPTKDRMFR